MITNIHETIAAINQTCEKLRELDNDALRKRYVDWKTKITGQTATLDNALVDVFALVKEVMCRFATGEQLKVTAQSQDKSLSRYVDFVQMGFEAEGSGKKALYKSEWSVSGEPYRWRMIPYDEQIQAGIELHNGKIVQMATGEGKTLVSIMPAILNALTGKGVHIMTANDYLSKRDYELTRPIYMFFGLSVSCIEYYPRFSRSKQEAYKSDVVFGQTSEFIFDYLFDNLMLDFSQSVQGPHNYIIIDEADAALIDEAQTPHIIQLGKGTDGTNDNGIYELYLPIVKRLLELEDSHRLYKVDEIRHQANFTKDGLLWLTQQLGDDHLFDADYYPKRIKAIEQDTELTEIQKKGLISSEHNLLSAQRRSVNALYQLLLALTVYHQDKDYIVDKGRIVIVDLNTGRPKPQHIWEYGLHQAVQAKEGISSVADRPIDAVVSMKNYLALYNKLSGMTGTALAAKDEFKTVYGVEVAHVSTHKPVIREDRPLRLFKSREAELSAIIDEVKRLHRQHRPVLIGCSSVRQSTKLSALLNENGISVQTLNAKTLANEAKMIAVAGQIDVVTVATSIAGRGTDIKPSDAALKVGGLAVIGMGLAHSKRIDEQLAGRSGRQGNPGSSQFFASLDDDVLIFLDKDDRNLLTKLSEGTDKSGEIHAIQTIDLFYKAQRNQEREERENRQELTQRDDLIAPLRLKVYELRRHLLQKRDDCRMMLRTFLPFLDDAAFRKNYNKHLQSLCDEVIPYIREALADMHQITRIAPLPFVYKEQAFAISSDFDNAIKTRGASLQLEYESCLALSIIDAYWVRFINEINNGFMPLSDIPDTIKRMRMSLEKDIRQALLHATPVLPRHRERKSVDDAPYNFRLATATGKALVDLMEPCPCHSGLPYCACHGRHVHL